MNGNKLPPRGYQGLCFCIGLFSHYFRVLFLRRPLPWAPNRTQREAKILHLRKALRSGTAGVGTVRPA